MKEFRICASIVDHDQEAITEIEPLVDIFEVRMDLIGRDWPEVVKHITKPWIACNRIEPEGGRANPEDAQRITDLLRAADAGARYVDIEYRTDNLREIVSLIKARTGCLISYHDLAGTPSYDILKNVVEGQLTSGAEVCKVVTTALVFEDNLTVLRLIREYPEIKIVALAMGEIGVTSRILCPLAGGFFTYGCISRGKESAPGQLTVRELQEISGLIDNK